MSNAQHAAFSGSVPAFYDRHLGPVIFEPYAVDIAKRLQPRAGARVLETACGTGIATKRLLAQLPPNGTMIATDLNPAMIEHARAHVPADERLSWQTADAMQLPFGDASFDAVVMQFGIMFVPDKLQALREAFRVLAPGGRLLVSAWDSFARNPWARIADDVLKAAHPAQPITFFQTPFGDHDANEHWRRTEAAGFIDVKVEGVACPGNAESADHFATGVVRGTPVGQAATERGTPAVAEIERRFAAALRRQLGDRPVRMPLNAWVVTGTKE